MEQLIRTYPTTSHYSCVFGNKLMYAKHGKYHRNKCITARFSITWTVRDRAQHGEGFKDEQKASLTDNVTSLI